MSYQQFFPSDASVVEDHTSCKENEKRQNRKRLWTSHLQQLLDENIYALFCSLWQRDKNFYLLNRETSVKHSWPVAAAGGLPNGMEHIGLLAVPCQTWEDQERGASGGIWVVGTGLIVHPVQRNLTTIISTEELTGA